MRFRQLVQTQIDPNSKFLEIPVYNFFLGQAHYKAWGYWPEHREWSHGNEGIIESYQELFRLSDCRLILKFLSENLKKRSLESSLVRVERKIGSIKIAMKK